MPSARNAALCIAGEREWATGSPMTVRSRVLALISTLALRGEAVGHGARQGLELLAGVAIDAEVAAKRIADLIRAPARVFAQHEHLSPAAQLVDACAMMPGHCEDQIGAVDQLAREQARAMPREVEAPFQADEVRALGSRGTVPRARPGRCHGDLEAVLLERALEQRGGERAAADVAGAHEQDVLNHGARRPTGPRSRSGSRPEPPGSTSVRGPGQNARANASADALNARPFASAIARSLINKRNGLLAARPFIAASAATSPWTAREPRP